MLLIAATICVSSCQQKLYFPDRANTPMLSKALEGKLSITAKPQANTSDSAHGNGSGASLGIDAAFAPANHFGIIASYRTVNNRRIDEDLGPFWVNSYGGLFNGNRWELGAGYFTAFEEKGRAEVYAGYGSGTLNRRGYATPERDFDTKYHRYFIQGAIGMGNDIFTFGGGLRFAAQRFTDFTSPTTPDLRYQILESRQDVQSVTFAFMEPFVNAEVGWKFIRYTMQVGTSVQINGDKIVGNTPFYISLGACFHLDPDYFKPGGLSAHPNGKKEKPL
jgi:hypothetical protein